MTRTEIEYLGVSPFLAVARQAAPLVAGAYTFNAPRARFNPDSDIRDNALYIFDSFTFSCDIDARDYEAAQVNPLRFGVYTDTGAQVPTLPRPITLPSYVVDYGYGYLHDGRRGPTSLFFTFNGLLNHTAALVGKASITATVVMRYYEIIDDAQIECILRRRKANAHRV